MTKEVTLQYNPATDAALLCTRHNPARNDLEIDRGREFISSKKFISILQQTEL